MKRSRYERHQTAICKYCGEEFLAMHKSDNMCHRYACNVQQEFERNMKNKEYQRLLRKRRKGGTKG